MPKSNDCVNTQTELGQNLTPVEIVKAARLVLGGIELDPCSDLIANLSIKAERFYRWQEDGFSKKQWEAKTGWLNPPGISFTGGTEDERIHWHSQLKTLQNAKTYMSPSQFKEFKKEVLKTRPKDIKTISASDWFTLLHAKWRAGDVQSAMGLVYRAGSIGSLGKDLLSDATICLTCSGVESSIVNGSGRFSFDIVSWNGDRKPQTSNTQSSLIFLLSHDKQINQKFHDVFSQFGVIK